MVTRVLTVGSLVIAPGAPLAATVAGDRAGSVTPVSGAIGEISVGETITGSYSYDSNVPLISKGDPAVADTNYIAGFSVNGLNGQLSGFAGLALTRRRG